MIAARNATNGRTTAIRLTVRSALVMVLTLPRNPGWQWRPAVSPDGDLLEPGHKFSGDGAQALHGLAKLGVRQVRRGAQTEVPAAAVGRDAARRERRPQVARDGRVEREEPGERIERRAAVAGQHGRREVERVDLRREQRDLVAVGRLEQRGGQAALGEEADDADGAVVARRVVGRAREARG